MDAFKARVGKTVRVSRWCWAKIDLFLAPDPLEMSSEATRALQQGPEQYSCCAHTQWSLVSHPEASRRPLSSSQAFGDQQVPIFQRPATAKLLQGNLDRLV